ncbi:GTPase-activating protein [Chytriomyces hyalinus]|nr:GTPase-activating protein [Chytriomyces hyalinus]
MQNKPTARTAESLSGFSAFAPPRRSSLMPTKSSEAQLVAAMEQMNAALESNPSAVTDLKQLRVDMLSPIQERENGSSQTGAAAARAAQSEFQTDSLGAAQAADTEAESQLAFFSSVLESAQTDKTYLRRFDALMRLRVRKGVPRAIRVKVWIALASADPEAMREKYEGLIATNTNDSPVQRSITRDIPRTFPKHPMFKDDSSEGQKALFNVLSAYAAYDHDCGYCQGLTFVVAPLLIQGMTEVEAFSVFVRLMEESGSSSGGSGQQVGRTFALRTLFTPDMPGLHLLLHQHAELVRILLPNLHAKFTHLGITATTYASPWFLTLFAYSFPLTLVERILDLIFSEGAISVMLKVSIVVLKKNEPLFSLMDDFESVLEVLKGFGTLLGVFKGDVEGVIQEIATIDGVINDALLADISRSYFTQKQITSTNHLEIQTLRSTVAALTMQNAELSRDKQQLSATLAAIHSDHIKDVQLLKEGLESRLESALGALSLERERVERLELELMEAKRLIKGLRGFNTVMGVTAGQ